MMKLRRLNQLMDDETVIKGKWRLNGDHELEYWEEPTAKRAKFKVPIIEAESNALVVVLATQEKAGTTTTYTARLTGTWRLNQKNQIVFEIEKEDGKTDLLTFKGRWQVNRSNEIIYFYEEKNLKRGTRRIQTLTFKGHWDITEKNRLSYLLEGDTESAFHIRGAFQTQSILAKEGALRYQFGIEIGGRRRLETITLFGKWKLSRALELSFEIEYGDGRKKVISFGAEYHLGQDHTIQASVTGEDGKPLGFEVVFTKEFMEGEGAAFLRLRRSLEGESALEAGVKIPW